MNTDTTWPEYLRALSNNQSAIARAAGVNTGTVSRWMSGQVLPKAEQVIKVARRFDESPLGALVAAGYLEAAEIPSGIVMPRVLQLQRFSDVELAREIFARAVINRDGPVREFTPLVTREQRQEEARKREELSEVDATVGNEEEQPRFDQIFAAPTAMVDDRDTDEDFDVEPDAGERQASYGLAAKRGARKADQPHAE